MVLAQKRAFSLCQSPRRRAPLSMSEERKEGGLPVMKSDTGLANLAIEQVLELSADAHIERRMTAQDSEAFHRLTGAILAYGRTLSLLVALEEREEFFAMIAQLNLPASVSGLAH